MSNLGEYQAGTDPTQATTPPPPGDNVFQQGAGPIVMEAENYQLNTVASNAHRWELTTTPTGAAGNEAMMALPNTGTNNNTGYESNSPRLDYDINSIG